LPRRGFSRERGARRPLRARRLVRINKWSPHESAGKPAARHLPVNGQCIAASAVNAERASERNAPPPLHEVERGLGGEALFRVRLGPPLRLARTWQHVLPRRPASTAAPPAAPRSRSR